MESFLQSNNWQMYINVCIRQKIVGNEFLEKLNKLIENLKNSNKLLECSMIYENYMNDSENSIMCLIEGAFWQEAITSVIIFLYFFI